MARARSTASATPFIVLHQDVLNYAPTEPFDLVFDSGCLHNMNRAGLRAYRSRLLGSWLRPGGDYMLETGPNATPSTGDPSAPAVAPARAARPWNRLPLPSHHVTLALDAGATLRDVQDFARHKDPRTTRRYDRSRANLDRSPAYTLAAYLS